MWENNSATRGKQALNRKSEKPAHMYNVFEIAFQPIVSATSGLVHHFEALARFPNGYGDRSPGEHIVVAEQTGRIVDFDTLMIERVLAVLDRTPALLPVRRIAVNISGHSIVSPEFHHALDRLIEEYSPAPEQLLFEITETARITNLAEANESIQRLRECGFLVCLDDFSAGAADFHYLSALDLDIVKLDGFLLRLVRHRPKGGTILRALSRLCNELGVSTVAETVDDVNLLAYVRDCGIDFVQGFLFGEPSTDVSAFPPSMPAHLFPFSAAPTDCAGIG